MQAWRFGSHRMKSHEENPVHPPVLTSKHSATQQQQQRNRPDPGKETVPWLWGFLSISKQQVLCRFLWLVLKPFYWHLSVLVESLLPVFTPAETWWLRSSVGPFPQSISRHYHHLLAVFTQATVTGLLKQSIYLSSKFLVEKLRAQWYIKHFQIPQYFW